MLKLQIADTDIDVNSHNYHKIDTRNLRLGLVHGWHCMVGTSPGTHEQESPAVLLIFSYAG